MTERGRRPGVTVTGSGSAAAPVDRVTMNLAVSVIRADAGEAFLAAAHTATRVLSVLADDGADARSVRTANLTLIPRTEFHNNSEVLVGYEAGHSLIVNLPGLAGLERMLSDVVGSGEGVRILGVSLIPSDEVSYSDQARAAAFAEAKAKALQLATLAGRALGEVAWIEDGVPARTAPEPMRLARSTGNSMATGDALISASVTVRWEFAD